MICLAAKDAVSNKEKNMIPLYERYLIESDISNEIYRGMYMSSKNMGNNVIIEYKFCSGSIEPVYLFNMHIDAKIVHVCADRDGFLTMWAIEDINKRSETRYFHIVSSYKEEMEKGKGVEKCHIIEISWIYVGTCVFETGQVFHVFEEKK